MFDQVSNHYITKAFHRFRPATSDTSTLAETTSLLSAQRAQVYVSNIMNSSSDSLRLGNINLPIQPISIAEGFEKLQTFVQHKSSTAASLEKATRRYEQDPNDIEAQVNLLILIKQLSIDSFSTTQDSPRPMVGYCHDGLSELGAIAKNLDSLKSIFKALKPQYNSPELAQQYQMCEALMAQHQAWCEYMQADDHCLQSITNALAVNTSFLTDYPELKEQSSTDFLDVLSNKLSLSITKAVWLLDPYITQSKPSMQKYKESIGLLEQALDDNKVLMSFKETHPRYIETHDCFREANIVLKLLSLSQAINLPHGYEGVTALEMYQLVKKSFDDSLALGWRHGSVAMICGAYCIAEMTTLFSKEALAKAPSYISERVTLTNAYRMKNDGILYYARELEDLDLAQRRSGFDSLALLAARVFPKNPAEYKSKPLNTAVPLLLCYAPKSFIFPTFRASQCPPGVIS